MSWNLHGEKTLIQNERLKVACSHVFPFKLEELGALREFLGQIVVFGAHVCNKVSSENFVHSFCCVVRPRYINSGQNLVQPPAFYLVLMFPDLKKKKSERERDESSVNTGQARAVQIWSLGLTEQHV